MLYEWAYIHTDNHYLHIDKYLLMWGRWLSRVSLWIQVRVFPGSTFHPLPSRGLIFSYFGRIWQCKSTWQKDNSNLKNAICCPAWMELHARQAEHLSPLPSRFARACYKAEVATELLKKRSNIFCNSKIKQTKSVISHNLHIEARFAQITILTAELNHVKRQGNFFRRAVLVGLEIQ